MEYESGNTIDVAVLCLYLVLSALAGPSLTKMVWFMPTLQKYNEL